MDCVGLDSGRAAVDAFDFPVCHKCKKGILPADRLVECVCKRFFCEAHKVDHRCSRSCVTCRKRVNVVGLIAGCRCGKVFCAVHRHDHGCSYDYAGAERARLKDALRDSKPGKWVNHGHDGGDVY